MKICLSRRIPGTECENKKSNDSGVGWRWVQILAPLPPRFMKKPTAGSLPLAAGGLCSAASSLLSVPFMKG